MSSLSQGPYTYNRFSAIDQLRQQEMQYFTEKAKEKKAKPDFLDVDGDGDKEESFKKGVKDKEKGEGKKDGKKELPAFLQKKEMKEGKCSSGCDCDDCKKSKKKAMNEWIEELVQEGYDLSQYNMEQMEEMYDAALEEALEESNPTIQEAICQYLMDNGFANNTVSAEVLFSNMSEGWRDSVVNEIQEIYQGKHGQTEKQYQDGRSPAGKMISGDSKGSGANYSYRAKNTGPNPAGGSQKPQGQAKMNNKDRAFLNMQKANMKRG